MKAFFSLVPAMALLVLSVALWQPTVWDAAMQQLERLGTQLRLQQTDARAENQNSDLTALDQALMRADARVRELDTGYGLDEALYARNASQEKIKAIRRELPAVQVLVQSSRQNAALEQHYRDKAPLVERSTGYLDRVMKLESSLIEKDI